MIPSSPEPFTFLVLSDIHFGTFGMSREFSSDPSISGGAHSNSIVDGIISRVLALPHHPTAIFVPGDLTSIGSPSEFRNCTRILIELADKLGISRDSVYCTFGNHDLDWRISNLAPESKEFPADIGYHDVAAHVGSLYFPSIRYTEPGPLPGSGILQTHNYTLFIANSGYYSTNSSVRHGKLGKEQLDWIGTAFQKYNCPIRWKIMMLHHHPFNYTYPTPIHDVSCIEEGAEVVELAGHSGVDFVCHGHRHHPRLFTDLRTGWSRPITFFCAGSVGVIPHHRDEGRIPNLFHVVSITNRLSQGNAFGCVTSFELASDGWRSTRDCPETPLDHEHWFGALATGLGQRQAVETFIRNAVAGPNLDSPIFLPSHSALPPEIKCCRLADLNTLLKEEAPRQGYRLIGKYPEDVALFRI